MDREPVREGGPPHYEQVTPCCVSACTGLGALSGRTYFGDVCSLSCPMSEQANQVMRRFLPAVLPASWAQNPATVVRLEQTCPQR